RLGELFKTGAVAAQSSPVVTQEIVNVDYTVVVGIGDVQRRKCLVNCHRAALNGSGSELGFHTGQRFSNGSSHGFSGRARSPGSGESTREIVVVRGRMIAAATCGS